MAPDAPITRDAILGGRLTLAQPSRGHRVGHDAVLLASAAGPDAETLVDFGAGVGAVGLCALARFPLARATLVEREPNLAVLAQENAKGAGLGARCEVICADVRRLNMPDGARIAPADLVLANPPFNLSSAHRTSPEAGRAAAHMADEGLLEAWVVAAVRCLKVGGRLAVILRPSDVRALLDAVSGRFGALELLPVHPRPQAPAVRLLARAIKGRRTAPSFLPPLILADESGAPAPRAQAVLRGEAGLFAA